MEKMNVKRLNRILSYLFSEMRDLDDMDRDLPIRWNVMHMYTSSQIAKILAMKRNLDPELAGIMAALHDIAVVKTKKTEDHARKAGQYIDEVIQCYNEDLRKNLPEITETERKLIIDAAIHHSEKEVKTENAYIELLKDVDSLDRFLHGIKTENAHLDRCNEVCGELKLR